MSDPAQRRRLKILICLGLGLITLWLYLPSLRQDFLPYDDQQYVTENRQVQGGLTGQGVAWAFGYHAGNWHPLTWLSHMLDCQLYGLKPAGHHLTNVLLHVANTLLLFLLMNRMTGAMWRSAWVAALFAWHPLHVESVAWVAERKDVLSACCWMITLLCYVHYAAKPGARRYLATLATFILALMAKPMAVTLPCVLLLLDFWPLGRFRPGNSWMTLWPLVREKLPFFALSALACVLTISAQSPAIVSTAGLSIAQRFSHALVAYAHYLSVAFLPRGLAIYYPYEIDLPAGQVIGSGLLLVLITILAFRFATRLPFLLVGWLWYLGTLVPVIGLVQVGDQAWADRYTYLPLIGIFIAVVWGVAQIARSPRHVAALATTVALALLLTTTAQLGHWKDARTLFTHTARVTPSNYMAVTLLGSLLAKEGKLDEAIAHYQMALGYKPGYPEAHFFIGNALDQQGKLDEAITNYQRSLWFKPTQEPAHIFLGIALAKQKKYDEASVHYLAALKLNPESAVAHNNFARLLHVRGQLDNAAEHYSAALRLDPDLAPAHNNLGILLLQKGQWAQGAAHLREALRLNPGNPESQYNLALALNQQEQWSEAAALFAKTVDAASPDPNAHYQFALALAHGQRPREAMSHYARALLMQPDLPDALAGLAWILATDSNPEFRNGPEALRMAARACELTANNDPAKLKVLAAAYAETGRFPEAIATADQAQGLAERSGKRELATQCQRLRNRFSGNQPWREERNQE